MTSTSIHVHTQWGVCDSMCTQVSEHVHGCEHVHVCVQVHRQAQWVSLLLLAVENTNSNGRKRSQKEQCRQTESSYFPPTTTKAKVPYYICTSIYHICISGMQQVEAREQVPSISSSLSEEDESQE